MQKTWSKRGLICTHDIDVTYTYTYTTAQRDIVMEGTTSKQWASLLYSLLFLDGDHEIAVVSFWPHIPVVRCHHGCHAFNWRKQH